MTVGRFSTNFRVRHRNGPVYVCAYLTNPFDPLRETGGREGDRPCPLAGARPRHTVPGPGPVAALCWAYPGAPSLSLAWGLLFRVPRVSWTLPVVPWRSVRAECSGSSPCAVRRYSWGGVTALRATSSVTIFLSGSAARAIMPLTCQVVSVTTDGAVLGFGVQPNRCQTTARPPWRTQRQ